MSSISTSYYSNLASYFASKPLYLDEPLQKKPNTRKLVEQPWQQTKGELWDEVTDTLCNLDFIQAKAAAKMTYEMVNDFNAVLEVIPDNQETIREEKARQERMEKYTQDLIACAKGTIKIDELKIPESISPLTHEQINSDLERKIYLPTNVDKLNDFFIFLGNEAHNLENEAHEISNFAVQQAWNFSNNGPVAKYAESTSGYKLNQLLLLSNAFRPKWFPNPQKVRIIKQDDLTFLNSAMTPDGKYALTVSWDCTCALWNLNTGELINIIKGHAERINGVDITPDFHRAITASDDRTCIVWDLVKLEPITTLFGHLDKVVTVAITPDGRYAMTGSEDHTNIFWNIETSTPIYQFSNPNEWESLNDVSITADGKRAIGVSNEGNCFVWDLDKGCPEFNLYTNKKNKIALTPTGDFAILSYSHWGECGVLDLRNKIPVFYLIEDIEGINDVDITPDGKYAIIGLSDSKCVHYDITKKKVIKTLIGHNGSINNVAITADGSRAFTCGSDDKCILWDLITSPSAEKVGGFDERLSSFSIHPDGQTVVFANGNSITFGNLTTGSQLYNRKWSENGILRKVAISPDGNRIFSSFRSDSFQMSELQLAQATLAGKPFPISLNDCDLHECDILTGKLIRSLHGHSGTIVSIVFTPDGKTAVTGAMFDKKIILWDLIHGNPSSVIFGNGHAIKSISITPDGKNALTASSDDKLILWNFFSQKITVIFETFSGFFKANAISPDGRIVLFCSDDQLFILEITKSFKNHRIIDIKGITTISFTHDGSGFFLTFYRSRSCELWDIIKIKKRALFLADDFISEVKPYKLDLAGEYGGGFFKIEGNNSLTCPEIAITTIKQIWDFNVNNNTKPLVDCPLCGHRFEPNYKIVKTIIQISKDAGIRPDQSPCFELPDEAWEHPELLGKCPNCHEKLKFNPFFGSDTNEIQNYYSLLEREQQFQNKFKEAEKAYTNEKWEEAYNLYLKLIHQGNSDVNYLRFNMALCRLNTLSTDNPEIINNINILIQLLRDKGANDKAQLINDQLKKRLATIKQEELAKKKAEASWWKKMFGN